jgi:hypothetical protein
MKRWKLGLVVALAASSLCAISVGGVAITMGVAVAAPDFSSASSSLLAQTPPASAEPVLPEPVQAEPLQQIQYEPVPDWRTLFPAPVWSVLLGLLTTVMTAPLTGVFKGLLGTDGINTVVVNASLNTFFAGLLPWLTGIYPPTLSALFYVALATGIGMLMDKAAHFSIKQTALNAAKPGGGA